MTDLIRFESRRAGAIEVHAADVLEFEPLPGFPNRRRFVLMEHGDRSELAWLVSLDDADLAFVVTNPWTFFPNYDPPVAMEHLTALEIEKREEAEILCLVTLDGTAIHLNLLAPLLINVSTRKALQVVTDDRRYSTRMRIPRLEDRRPEESTVEAATATRTDSAPTP